MIILDLKHTDSKTLLQTLAQLINVPYHGADYIAITPPAGTGIIKVIDVAEELQVLLIDVTLNKYFVGKRSPGNHHFYGLHFEQVLVTDAAIFSVDGETLQKKNTLHAVARLTSNMFYNSEEITAHTPVKAVKVFFSERWLTHYLGVNNATEALRQYLMLKTESFDMEPLDAEYLRLMDEIWAVRKDDPLQNMYLRNRATLLIERFFTRLHQKAGMVHRVFNLSEDEIQRLIKVEQLLAGDFTEAPPTIDAFSKMVSMSSTKLKKSFKEVYGNSIYSYYQKLRMERARELLLSGDFSIRQAAKAVGYVNTANFISAFKKQYSVLPGELIEKI
ncbi:MAG: hypothetical protein RL172_1005 [Bacteroidota bacterium]|jgi:AraC-like DNA-binding protein